MAISLRCFYIRKGYDKIKTLTKSEENQEKSSLFVGGTFGDRVIK